MVSFGEIRNQWLFVACEIRKTTQLSISTMSGHTSTLLQLTILEHFSSTNTPSNIENQNFITYCEYEIFFNIFVSINSSIYY